MKIALDIDFERVAPGEDLIGRVRVLEGGKSRSVTVSLSFHESTRDYDVAVYNSDAALHEGDLESGQTLDFSFTLPPDTWPSIKCEHSELYWELEVKSDEAGLDTHARRRITVG